MMLANPLQNQPIKRADAKASDAGSSYNLSQSATADPYEGLNKIAGHGVIDLNVSISPTTQTSRAVGPLTIERAIAPTAEIVVLPRGSHLQFSPNDISPDLGNRPDVEKITVRGRDNILVFPDATPVTDNGDGSYLTQQRIRAILPEAAIRFPGENSVVRFDGFPVWLEKGAVVHPAHFAVAA